MFGATQELSAALKGCDYHRTSASAFDAFLAAYLEERDIVSGLHGQGVDMTPARLAMAHPKHPSPKPAVKLIHALFSGYPSTDYQSLLPPPETTQRTGVQHMFARALQLVHAQKLENLAWLEELNAELFSRDPPMLLTEQGSPRAAFLRERVAKPDKELAHSKAGG